MKSLKNLKNLRKEAGLSQLQLAEHLNVDRSTIAKYESGEREPDLATLCKMADILQLTVDELLDRD